jgi:hypothetical protein
MYGIVRWTRQAFLQFQFTAMHFEIGFDIPGAARNCLSAGINTSLGGLLLLKSV